MRLLIPCVETHTCGEPTRTVIGGFPNLPGETIRAKQVYIQEHLDHVRKSLIREPRGHRGMFGAILTPPVSPDAVCGVVWFDNAGYLSGCGHGTIGVGITLVETGMVPASGPLTTFTVDSPSGLLRLSVRAEGGRARETSFENVPAFSVGSDLAADVPGLGRIHVDIAFGGNFFAILDAAQAGLEIRPDKASHLAEVGLKIREAVNAQVPIRHPTMPHLDRVQIVTFVAPPTRPGARYLNTHMFGDGAIDRSPGGTGTSAVMTALYAKGKLAIGEEVVAEGIAGGLFRGRLLRQTALGDRPAVVPEITGPAYITAFHQFVLDSDDPWAEGFELH
ncbi:MAG: proline racemase family protein [Armatimonadetes bacterium]|nr:proline racemase family protein [Armatimonadota bacterium]